ncbi:MAG: phosphotransferase [Chloroflexi bacterium]|nr:phosphotransferase [Chloroflexota bacterium]
MSYQTRAEELEDLTWALEHSFPELCPIGPLRFIGHGFRSVAVETAGGVLMRVGTSLEAATGYELEMRALPFIRSFVDPVVPTPRWYTEPVNELPHGALGYPKLSGHNPKWGIEPPISFAHALGRFMAQLHSAPVSEARASGIGDVDATERLIGAEDIVLPVLRERLPYSEFAHVQEWWGDFRSDDHMRRYEARVCHHDLWHGNLLIDEEGGLSGVLDWAHIEIGDSAHDFAAPKYFGEQFWNRLLEAYLAAGGEFGPDEHHRAQKYWEGREFGGIAWAIEHSDDAELE